MDAELFTRFYLAIATYVMPEVTIILDGPLRLTMVSASGPKIQIRLEDPYADYLHAPDAMEDIVQGHFRGLLPGQVQAMKAPQNAERFTRLYMALANLILPDATVTHDGPLRLTVVSAAGPKFQVHLEDAFADYRRHPDALQDIVQDHLLGPFRTVKHLAANRSATPDDVVPLIRERA